MAIARSDPLTCRRSARTDIGIWMMLLVGAVFVYAGYTVDPQSNCNDSGECAPWLVPVGGIMGLAFVGMALATLLANPQRGSTIDPASGELVWWKNRTAMHPGDQGRIDPRHIARIRVITSSDSSELHVYDQAGERLPYFDCEVIRGAPETWARHAVQRWPHVAVVVEG